MTSNTLQVLKAPKEKTKRIVVSEDNYNKLMENGKFHETFDDVITRILTSQKAPGGDF
jgi:predicted CopG family antitoxin